MLENVLRWISDTFFEKKNSLDILIASSFIPLRTKTENTYTFSWGIIIQLVVLEVGGEKCKLGGKKQAKELFSDLEQ